jgi:hypothetical protein
MFVTNVETRMKTIDIQEDFFSVYVHLAGNLVVLNADIDVMDVALNGCVKTVKMTVITGLADVSYRFGVQLI